MKIFYRPKGFQLESHINRNGGCIHGYGKMFNHDFILPIGSIFSLEQPKEWVVDNDDGEPESLDFTVACYDFNERFDFITCHLDIYPHQDNKYIVVGGNRDELIKELINAGWEYIPPW